MFDMVVDGIGAWLDRLASLAGGQEAADACVLVLAVAARIAA